MRRLAEAFHRSNRHRRVEMTLVHEAPKEDAAIETVAKDVRAMSWQAWAMR